MLNARQAEGKADTPGMGRMRAVWRGTRPYRCNAAGPSADRQQPFPPPYPPQALAPGLPSPTSLAVLRW